jgi:hypothetical protein
MLHQTCNLCQIEGHSTMRGGKNEILNHIGQQPYSESVTPNCSCNPLYWERERCWINTCCWKFWTQKFPSIMYYCWNWEDIFFADFENNLELLCVENCTFANLIMPRGCQGWLAISVWIKTDEHTPTWSLSSRSQMSWHLCVSLHLQNPSSHLPNCDHHNSSGMTCKVCEPYLVTFLIRHLYLSGV